MTSKRININPSTCASALIFLITGVYTLCFLDNQYLSNLPSSIQIIIYSSIFLNAIYYFYIEIVTELDKKFMEKLDKVNPIEWWIRVFNQTILFSLWFLLQFDNLYAFAIALFFLYLSYIMWDLVVWDCFNNKYLFLLDVLGLVATSFFILLGYLYFKELNTIKPNGIERETTWSFLWGAVIFIYAIIPLLGFLIKSRPRWLLNLLYG